MRVCVTPLLPCGLVDALTMGLGLEVAFCFPVEAVAAGLSAA